jgi:hypothetical protein
MKRSRSEASPGASVITTTTATTIAPRVSSDRRRLDAENSSGSGSATTSGSRYSTLSAGLVVIGPCEHADSAPPPGAGSVLLDRQAADTTGHACSKNASQTQGLHRELAQYSSCAGPRPT